MFSFGLVVSLGLIVVLWKLSWRTKLLVFGHPLAADIGVFILLTVVHWGTFSGVMVATVGALFTSLTLSAGAKLFGRIVSNRYYPGIFNMIHKLKE